MRLITREYSMYYHSTQPRHNPGSEDLPQHQAKVTNLCFEHFVIDGEQSPDRDPNLQHHLIDKVNIPTFVARVLFQKLDKVLQREEPLTASVCDTQGCQFPTNALHLALG